MRFKQNGNKRDLVAWVIHNAEATASIQLGQPVCLNLINGTNDGIDVVLPSTAHAQNSGNEFQCLYGVALSSLAGGIPTGAFGEAQVSGFCADIAFTSATRASSTNSWSSIASIAAFLPLIPETVGNGWTTYAKDEWVTGSASSISANAAFPAFQVLLAPQSVSGTSNTGLFTIAASASNVSDTRTALFTLVRGYIRIL